MDRQEFVGVDGALLVDGLSDDVDDSSEGLSSHRHHNRVAGVKHLLASDESLGGVQGNGPHIVSSEVLSDLQDQSVVDSLHLKGVQDGWQVTLELDIDDGSNDLRNFSNRLRCAESS